jgi:class 3 adenylate cyclase
MAPADSVDSMATPSESAQASSAATFRFADIAGFTALTEAHGDEQAATLAADFCDAVKAELPACDAGAATCATSASRSSSSRRSASAR